jgi:hypothetical protein
MAKMPFIRNTLAILTVAILLWVGVGILQPAVTLAADTKTPTCSGGSFLGLEPWYNYLNGSGYLGDTVNQKYDPCAPSASFSAHLLDANGPIPLILLAVIDDLLRIAGLIAVFFVIYGGVRYVTSQGKPDETAKAQASILNAVIGLAISLTAIALVTFLGSQLAGNPGKAVATSPDVISLSVLPHTPVDGSFVQTILGIAFGVIGALSLLFVVIGGFRYVISAGNPKAVQQAKNTITYALIGLLVAILAQVIVTFVIGRLG